MYVRQRKTIVYILQLLNTYQIEYILMKNNKYWRKQKNETFLFY